MELRAFSPVDAPALYEVFFSAIHRMASVDYNPEQIAAWAPASVDLDSWTARLTRLNPLVVEAEGKPIAYAALQSDGHVDDFYVSAEWIRRGVGSMLMRRVLAIAEERGIATLYSDVSVTAQAFFGKFGFRVIEQRMPIVRGVAMPNARMVKSLTANNALGRARR
jgi:putative acetyltransferase